PGATLVDRLAADTAEPAERLTQQMLLAPRRETRWPQVLAEVHRVHVGSVRPQRMKRRHWTKSMLLQRGRVADNLVAQRFGVIRPAAQIRSKLVWDKVLNHQRLTCETEPRSAHARPLQDTA